MRVLGQDGTLGKTFLATQEKEWCVRMIARVLVDFDGEYDRCAAPACFLFPFPRFHVTHCWF